MNLEESTKALQEHLIDCGKKSAEFITELKHLNKNMTDMKDLVTTLATGIIGDRVKNEKHGAVVDTKILYLQIFLFSLAGFICTVGGYLIKGWLS